jgi:hypothetical protein
VTAAGDPRVTLDEQECVRGAAHTYTVTVRKTNSDGSTSPVDLTTYGTTWSGQLRGEPGYAAGTAWHIDASSAATGVLVLSLTGAETAAMPSHATGRSTDDDLADTFGYDLEVTGGTVSPQIPFKGVLRLWKAYTHG